MSLSWKWTNVNETVDARLLSPFENIHSNDGKPITKVTKLCKRKFGCLCTYSKELPWGKALLVSLCKMFNLIQLIDVKHLHYKEKALLFTRSVSQMAPLHTQWTSMRSEVMCDLSYRISVCTKLWHCYRLFWVLASEKRHLCWHCWYVGWNLWRSEYPRCQRQFE